MIALTEIQVENGWKINICNFCGIHFKTRNPTRTHCNNCTGNHLTQNMYLLMQGEEAKVEYNVPDYDDGNRTEDGQFGGDIDLIVKKDGITYVGECKNFPSNAYIGAYEFEERILNRFLKYQVKYNKRLEHRFHRNRDIYYKRFIILAGVRLTKPFIDLCRKHKIKIIYSEKPVMVGDLEVLMFLLEQIKEFFAERVSFRLWTSQFDGRWIIVMNEISFEKELLYVGNGSVYIQRLRMLLQRYNIFLFRKKRG